MKQSVSRVYKDELFDQFARIGKALASPQRLEFLDLLANCEWSVEALARETQQSVANTSRHLQVLRSARLVDTRREGVTIYYRLADPAVLHLWHALATWAPSASLRWKSWSIAICMIARRWRRSTAPNCRPAFRKMLSWCSMYAPPRNIRLATLRAHAR